MIYIPFLLRFSGDVKTKESRSVSYDCSGYEVLIRHNSGDKLKWLCSRRVYIYLFTKHIQ